MNTKRASQVVINFSALQTHNFSLVSKINEFVLCKWISTLKKPFDSFAISLSCALSVICARRSISNESSHTFLWQYMDFENSFWMSKSEWCGASRLFSSRAGNLWIYCKVIYHAHAVVTSSAQKVVVFESDTRKVEKSLAKVKLRHKWFKSHAALSDS